MENIKISKICGLCAGCRFAINSALGCLKSNKPVVLYKEIVHNNSVNGKLQAAGIRIEDDISKIKGSEIAVIRTHGEPKETYNYFNEHNIQFCDCTCKNVMKIHNEVSEFSKKCYKVIIIGKYGKKTGTVHPEIFATISWCETEPILIEDEKDAKNFEPQKNQKYFLICQTTFNIDLAKKLSNEIKTKCEGVGSEIVINLSICNAQKLINEASGNLAKTSDLMFVVGSKHSSNTTELFNNLSKICKTIFVEDITLWKEELEKNKIDISSKTKIGLTAGASTDPEELKQLKSEIEKFIEENNL